MGGTPSGDKASNFVLRTFKEFGLKPEYIKDSEKPTFVHERWTLRVEQPKSLRGLIQNEWLSGFSPSVKERVSKLTYIDLAGITKTDSVAGKTVLVAGKVSQTLYDNLAVAGAKCILSYEVVHSSAYSNWAMITNLKAVNSNPIPLFNISNLAGKRLKQELQRKKTITIRYATKTKFRKGNPKTVVATLRGEVDSCLIVCAHGDSDSGGPGADDNASGVAGVLELARCFAGLRSSGDLPKPKRTIKFIVWGSEYFSTEDYVKKHQLQLGTILGVINYDEIGTGKARNCLYFEGNDNPLNERLLRILEKVGNEFAGKKGFWKEATTNPSQGGTDSYVFLPDYLQRLQVPVVQIPAVTVYTAAWNEPKTLAQTSGWTSRSWKGKRDSVVIDYSLFYHSSLDLPKFTTEKEPFNMVWAVKAVGLALLRIAW